MNPFRSLFISLSRIPPVLMLLVILGLAVVVTMYVMNVVGGTQAALESERLRNAAKENQKVNVVYATRNIGEGEIISAESLEERGVASGNAPVDAFGNTNAVVGLQAAYPIVAGAIVSSHAIRPMSQLISFEGRIREGMRALTFGVDTNSGVAGFIAPGSRVDVLAITGSADSTKAAPVMSDVQVVAVGTTYQKSPGGTTANPAGSVTVAVSPDDSIKLVKAISAAKLYLTLRNDRDHTPVAVVDVKDLFPKHESINIASLPQDLPLPQPPMPSLQAPESVNANAIATPPLPPLRHEIEMWSGTRKEVLSVPQG